MKYSIHLNVYDGPLDLLCDMISKQKIDIKDISIIEITKQYLAYINMLEAMDLEVTSDFITMATKLLEIKSKYLLFSQRELDEEEDPRLELMEQLKEYKKYKKASEVLKDSVDYLNQPYYRNREEIIIDDKVDLNEISIESIKSILPYIFKVKNIEEENETKKDERLNKIVRGKIISVEEKIEYIQNILTTADKISFNNIIKDNTKDEVIATFLSLLELIKSKEIVVVQENFFEDIIIKKQLRWHEDIQKGLMIIGDRMLLIMFAYGEPISVKELNYAINEELSPKEIEYMLNLLKDEYEEQNRGIQIIKLEDRYQMCTNKDYTPYIKKVLEPKRKKTLSQATLETLTIIAYKQPITKVEIENIRGVKCDKVLQTLLENSLIREAGRLNKIGKPIIYKTTDEFLKLLNIEKLEDLPPIEEFEENIKMK